MLNSSLKMSLNKKLKRNSVRLVTFSLSNSRTLRLHSMVRNSQATKLDMFSMKTSNRPRNVFSSLINQDASATIKNHSRLISGKLKMNWFKLDMRNKEITSLNSSTLSRIKANKDKQLDKVVSKWVNNNLTTTSHNLVNLMMVSKTKEVE